MAFLEEDPELAYKPHPNPLLLGEGIVQAIDYTTRHPHVEGKKLGILTGTGNAPIQDFKNTIDLSNQPTTTISYFDSDSKLESNGDNLLALEGTIKSGGIASSCNSLLSKKSSLKGKDGVYIINPEGNNPFSVYCDMTTDGGGWTRVYNIDNYVIGNNEDLPLGTTFNSLISTLSFSEYMQYRKQSSYYSGLSYFAFKTNKYFSVRNENVFGIRGLSTGTENITLIVDSNGNYKQIIDGSTSTGIRGVNTGYLPSDIQYIDSLRTNGHQWSNGAGSIYNTDSGRIDHFWLFLR